MSRHSQTIHPSQCRNGDLDLRRRSTPLAVMNSNYMNSAPPVPTLPSPPPTPRARSSRSDRLSLRLRSNSGLKLHINESALSQYIDYDSNSHSPSFNPDKRNGSLFSETLASRDGETLSPAPSLSSPQAVPWTATGLASCLPFLDFLGKDAFQMAIESPSVIRHLIQYCEEHGCEETVEFLMKIREYNQVTQQMTAILSSLSTKFTGIGATKPMNFPASVSRPLNTDMKKIANNILPHLEHVFTDAKDHAENRLARDIFPGFAKSQLVRCTAIELGTGHTGGPSQWQYPGLGGSFCLTPPSSIEQSIVGASDEFASLTGYSLQDIVGRTCEILHGPFTDAESVRRIKLAVKDCREVVELILNHRADGEPFWNLLFLFPLKDSKGQVQYWLGAQIDVSHSLRSHEDLLRVLNCGVLLPDVDSGDNASNSDISIGLESTKDGRPSKPRSAHSRHKSFGASRNRLLQPFRRPTISSSSSPEIPYIPNATHVVQSEPISRAQSSASSASKLKRRHVNETQQTAYSQYLVLRCLRGDQQQQPLSDARKKSSTKLVVAFYSEAAVELLSIRGKISQADIFHVLAENAGSPSVTKSFKSLVREKLDSGKSVTMELLLEKSRKRGASTSNGCSRPALHDPENAHPEDRGDKKLTKSPKHESLLSHWTPLKDAKGNVDWVVLIVTPAS